MIDTVELERDQNTPDVLSEPGHKSCLGVSICNLPSMFCNP